MEIIVFVLSSRLKINVNFVIHQFHAHLAQKPLTQLGKQVNA
jgi:hypothetical protein